MGYGGFSILILLACYLSMCICNALATPGFPIPVCITVLVGCRSGSCKFGLLLASLSSGAERFSQGLSHLSSNTADPLLQADACLHSCSSSTLCPRPLLTTWVLLFCALLGAFSVHEATATKHIHKMARGNFPCSVLDRHPLLSESTLFLWNLLYAKMAGVEQRRSYLRTHLVNRCTK